MSKTSVDQDMKHADHSRLGRERETLSRRDWLRYATAVGTGLFASPWIAPSPFGHSVLGNEQAFRPRRILLDSDAKNEIDDQHAILRAFIAPELTIEGLTAAGYAGQAESAQRSYDEEVKLLDLMGLTGKVPVAMGSSLGLKDKKTPDETDAAKLIIQRALAEFEGLLYVIAIGQATNLASALLMEPRIKDRVIFVVLGGSYRAKHKPAWGAR